jgi:low temperature requirement protein LtrA
VRTMGYSRRIEGEGQRATTLELFYDLVFVFAITQVSHLLLEHLTWAGVGQSLLVLLVVWWSWNYTTWVTNELDTEAISVRLLMISLMLLSLLMAVERERAGRILIWFVAAGVLWVAGALADGPARVALWLAALALDYGAPLVVYRVPGLRRLAGSVWNVGTEHFAERFQLFIIIALGETIVITGATTAELDLDAATLAAFGMAFVTTAAMWWLYFNYVARIAQRQLELSADRTSLARDGYTYLHVVMVAGIIVSAVGDELVIAHPGEVLPAAEIAVVVGGPALYLLAHALFRRRMTGAWGPKRLYGAAGCLAVGAAGPFVPALVLAGLVIAVLAAVIASEHVAAARRARRGEPTPLERLEASAGTAATSPGPPDPG